MIHTLHPTIDIWVVGAGGNFPNAKKLVSFEKNWRPLSESMLRGHPQREMYRLMGMLVVPSAVNSAAVTAYMSAQRLKRSVNSKM